MCEECGTGVAFEVHEWGAGVGQLARVGGGPPCQPGFTDNNTSKCVLGRPAGPEAVLPADQVAPPSAT